MKYVLELSYLDNIKAHQCDQNGKIIFFDYTYEAEDFMNIYYNRTEFYSIIPINLSNINKNKDRFIHHEEIISVFDMYEGYLKHKITEGIVKDKKLFNRILSCVDMTYEIRDNKIVLKNSDGTDFTTHDGEVMYFENPTDAFNSIDWMFKTEEN